MTDNIKLAHSLESKIRTNDVLSVENILFDSLLLPEKILKGLSEEGFQKPSPIQLKALPVGRCGFDLKVKSKSGTGKTLVFGIIALETINVVKNNLQVLILAPTREIAVQIQNVLTTVGKYLEGLNVQHFIGGLPIQTDIIKCSSCHIAVGTPGRMKQLIREGHLVTNSVRLFVLDEADKLLENNFQNDINDIYNSLPDKKQVIMCSATYPHELESCLENYMLSPTSVSAEIESPLLLGLKQFVLIVRSSPNIVQQTKAKNEELLKILSVISFTQCLIFSNYQTRAESISNFLNRNGWNSTFISGAQNQTERLSSLSSLKDFKCRILISTDLTARGIDAANVDLVINYDIPADAMTYLHRMGRAGRYGSTGNCINLALFGQESKLLQNILGIIGGQNLSMPILDDSLSMEKPIDKKNLLFAEVPDNIKEFTDKCKTEIFEMKGKVSKKEKRSPKGKKDSAAKICMSGEEQIINKVVEEKLSDTDALTVLEQIASGNLELNTIESERKVNARITDLYKELLPSPPKISEEARDLKASDKKYPQTDSNIDLISILKQLTEEDTEESVMKNSEKKRKRSKSSIDCQNIELEKQELRQTIFCKNNALFSVAKTLSNVETGDEDDGYLTEYLGYLKARENLEATNVTIKDGDLKQSSTIADNEKLPFNDFLEDIFSFAYRSQVLNSHKSWQNYLPEEERNKLEDNYTSKDEQAHSLLDEENYNEYGEEEYDYDEDYDFEMEKEIQINYDGSEAQDASQDQNDISFMQWIPVEPIAPKDVVSKMTCVENKKLSPGSITVEESTLNMDNVTQIDVLNHPNAACVVASDNAQYYKQFSKYYHHCSNNLWQTGLSFDTVQNFDEWFCYTWQSQMSAVRNFIQRNVYMEEMRRFQIDHKKMEG